MLFVNTITYIHVLVCTYIRGGIYVSMSSHAVRNHAQRHVIGKIGLRSPAAECVRCCFLTPKSNAYVLYIIYVCVSAAWWYLYRELTSSVCMYCTEACDRLYAGVCELTTFSCRYISMREECPRRPPNLDIWLPDKSITC